jgi:hypothetical protein
MPMFRVRNIAAAGVLIFGASFATLGATGALAVTPAPAPTDLKGDVQQGQNDVSAKGTTVADTEVDTAAEEVQGENNQVEQVDANDNKADTEKNTTDTGGTAADQVNQNETGPNETP